MKHKLIYLSGAITGIPKQESYEWRKIIKDTFEDIEPDRVHVYNPLDHFSEMSIYIGKLNDSEIMDVDLYKLRNSDFVFHNCAYSKSLGTMAEIAIAYERKIPILSFNEKQEEIHPWLRGMISKIFTNKEELIDFFVRHYMYDE